MKENIYLNKKSAVVIVVVLAVLVVVSILFYGNRRQGNTVLITQNGKNIGTYPIGSDKTVQIKDSNGKITNTVCIRNGEVYMENADCPDQICVKQGHKSKDGESITCLPNRVVVEVRGDDRGDLDTFVQ